MMPRDYRDSASFFTRGSTGRPVFSLAATATRAAALRTARLRTTGCRRIADSDVGFVTVILLPGLAQRHMFADYRMISESSAVASFERTRVYSTFQPPDVLAGARRRSRRADALVNSQSYRARRQR